MNVRELIEFLGTVDPELPVAYQCCSEQDTLEAKDIVIKRLCRARPDGWIQNRRPDMESVPYLVFPGN